MADVNNLLTKLMDELDLDDMDVGKEVAKIVDAPKTRVDTVNVFAALQSWFPTNPLLWNACKHLINAADGSAEELEKALWYIQKELERCKPSSSS